MVRHTNKRRNSRRRRQTRGRRTQKGGFLGFSFGEDSIGDLQEQLNNEQNPEKKKEIEQKIALAKAKEQYDKTVKQIKERGTAQSNMSNQEYGNQYQNKNQEYGNQYQNKNQEYGNQYQNKNQEYRQSGDFGNSGQFGDNNFLGGGSRRRRRHRRK
jgi:hypothetical protein